jgi:hypothetical protein
VCVCLCVCDADLLQRARWWQSHEDARAGLCEKIKIKS